MPPDQYKELKAAYKASYAFRDKIDTDGFDHPQKVFDLTEALIRRGYSDDNITAMLGGNFRRLLGRHLAVSLLRDIASQYQQQRGNEHER